MSTSPRPDGEGYAVEVSLLKFTPRTLALAAACFVALVALFSWLGFGDVRQLAASPPVRNHAANQQLRAAPAAIPNSATSQPAPQTPRADAAAAEAAAQRAALPEPSPAGFAESPASSDAQTHTSQNVAPAAPGVAHNEAAATATANTPAVAANAPATAPAGGDYAVQTGSFSSVSEANERVSALRSAGFEARTAAVELGKRGTWYRVYSGRFASRAEASQHDRKLRASGAVGDTLVTPLQD